MDTQLFIVAENHFEQRETINRFLMASDVYELLYEAPNSEDFRSTFNFIKFHRIGAPMYMELSTPELGKDIILSCYIEKKGERFPVDIIDGCLLDNSVRSNTWLFANDHHEELSEIVSSAAIDHCGKISFRQYLEIIKTAKNKHYSFLRDSVDISAITQEMEADKDTLQCLRYSPFEYQETGYKWMKYMCSECNGCILADEMGLGKTFQLITLATDMIIHGAEHILIITPLSLATNWKKEFAKFSPSIDVFTDVGVERVFTYDELAAHPVVVTTYETVKSDFIVFDMFTWDLIVLDEGQYIKNPLSKRASIVKKLNRKNSIICSGTPFENHIQDIWSLVDFALPNYLGDLDQFLNQFPDDSKGAEMIEPLIRPIMIRRLVKDVLKGMPEKEELQIPIAMTDSELSEYNRYRLEILNELNGRNPSLPNIQRLRVYCCHPLLLKDEAVISTIDPDLSSSKYHACCELLDSIFNTGEKVIIFTSFIKMSNMFMRDLPNRFADYGVKVFQIMGATEGSKRTEIIDNFSAVNGPAVMIASPKATGTGLNITAANHVIHYNFEWNPSTEDQSTARAYRIGQEKTVHVYRLYYPDTVDEMVDSKIQDKRHFSDLAIIGTNGQIISHSMIMEALLKSPLIKGETNG